MRKILMVGLALLVSAAISSAAPVPCLTAVGSNVTTLAMGCTLGPLLFDLFSVTSAPPGTTIFLSAIGTVAANPNFSLGFQITTPAPPVDTIFTYRVSTLSGSPGISDVSNTHNGVSTT